MQLANYEQDTKKKTKNPAATSEACRVLCMISAHSPTKGAWQTTQGICPVQTIYPYLTPFNGLPCSTSRSKQ